MSTKNERWLIWTMHSPDGYNKELMPTPVAIAFPLRRGFAKYQIAAMAYIRDDSTAYHISSTFEFPEVFHAVPELQSLINMPVRILQTWPRHARHNYATGYVQELAGLSGFTAGAGSFAVVDALTAGDLVDHALSILNTDQIWLVVAQNEVYLEVSIEAPDGSMPIFTTDSLYEEDFAQLEELAVDADTEEVDEDV